MRRLKPTVGALVVVSHETDATIYRVKVVDGFRVGVIDAELGESFELNGETVAQAIQWQDVSIFKGLTVGQLKRAGSLPS
jgi:hypothetical protein